MRLSYFRHLWGVDKSWEQAFATFRDAGYVGVEAAAHEGDVTLLRSLCDAHGLRLSGMAYTRGTSLNEHFDSLREQVDRWLELKAERICAHSALDAWPAREAIAFYEKCVEYERSLPIPVAHETHRGRAFFNPWSTHAILDAVPGIRLCCDFSHWVCVAERLLDDCDAEIAVAASRCIEIHTRVGYEEGPQVPDPSAPEYAKHLAAHERWWKRIIADREAAGLDDLILVPEFGPPPYLHTQPHTKQPAADLDHVVEWMMARLRQTLA